MGFADDSDTSPIDLEPSRGRHLMLLRLLGFAVAAMGAILVFVFVGGPDDDAAISTAADNRTPGLLLILVLTVIFHFVTLEIGAHDRRRIRTAGDE